MLIRLIISLSEAEVREKKKMDGAPAQKKMSFYDHIKKSRDEKGYFYAWYDTICIDIQCPIYSYTYIHNLNFAGFLLCVGVAADIRAANVADVAPTLGVVAALRSYFIFR